MAEQLKTVSSAMARAVLRCELEELVVENAYLLDRQRFGELVTLYTEDCEVIRPLPPFGEADEQIIRGREALASWYAGPSWSETPRSMRHFVSNLRLETVTDREVVATLALLGYRYEGAGHSLAVPMMVGDYEDRYRSSEQGVWQIHRRRIQIAFLNQDLLDISRNQPQV